LPTLATKVRLACAQLGIDHAHLTVPTAIKACNEALGLEPVGPLMSQADVLAVELGLRFDQLPSLPPPPSQPPTPPRRDPSMPTLVVFDLDFTLWHPELYQLSSGPPFKSSSDGCVLTARGERLDLFPAARSALAELADAGVPVAVASRANEREWALEIMRRLRVDQRRTVADVIGTSPIVIQGGSKTKHLKHIAHETGVPLREILFFDNERTNIQEVEKLGPTCVYCPRGMTEGVFRDGLALHLGSMRGGTGPQPQGDDADDDVEAASGRRTGRQRRQAAAAGGPSARSHGKRPGKGKRPSKERRGRRGR